MKFLCMRELHTPLVILGGDEIARKYRRFYHVFKAAVAVFYERGVQVQSCTAAGAKVLPDADSGLQTGAVKGIYSPHHDAKAEQRNLSLIGRENDGMA